MFCQNNINSTKLEQMTKDERLNPWRPKISCKPAQNFVKCLRLNCLLSLSKMVQRYLSVVQVLLSFTAPTNLHCVLSICERKKVEEPLLQIQVHKRLGKAKNVNVTQHTRFCLSINYGAICFLFMNQICALYIAFGKCLYICDVVQ